MKEQFSIFGLWYTILFTSQLFLSLNKDRYVTLLQLKRKLDIFLENWFRLNQVVGALENSTKRYSEFRTRYSYATI